MIFDFYIEISRGAAALPMSIQAAMINMDAFFTLRPAFA